MKTFLIMIIFALSLLSCSQRNAFSNFSISKIQEKSEESIQSAKIRKGDNVDGIVTAVYLNKVFPQRFHTNEYFYLYMYSKIKSKHINFMLNNHKALSVQELNASNEFTQLTSFKEAWSKYYLIEFPKQDENVSLKVIYSDFSSENMIFPKEEK